MNEINQKVYVSYKTAGSVEEKVKNVLEQMGGLRKWVRPGEKILIKPNFVAPFKKAVTDFDVIRVVVNELKSIGCIPVIAESSGYEFNTEQTFRLLGAYDLARELNVELINLDNQPYRRISIKDGLVRNYEISEIAFSVDAIINLPRLKKHSQTDITCGMKNLFGLLSRKTRAKIHIANLDKGIMELNRIVKPVLTIVDTSAVLERAVFGREKKDRQKELGEIIAGHDVLAVDRFCCALLGIIPDSIGHILIASQNKTGSLKFKTVNSTRKGDDQLKALPFSIKNKLHRLVYRSVYSFEIVLSYLIGMRSIVPYFHYYLGIRPKLNADTCNQCGECIKVCPIEAIDLNKKVILKECMHLRCLRCYEICELKAIEIIGRRSLENPLEETGAK